MNEDLEIERTHATDEFDTLLSVGQCDYISQLIYHTILNDIRNMRILSNAQSRFLRTLSRDKLIDILDIYNRIMENVKSAFE